MPKPSSSKQAPAKSGKTVDTGGSGVTGKGAAASPVAWPVFKPALPVIELALESIVPDRVLVIRNFWPRSLCRDYVAFLRGLPLVTTPGRPRRGEAVRVNDRFQTDDALFAARLWQQTGLSAALGQAKAELW